MFTLGGAQLIITVIVKSRLCLGQTSRSYKLHSGWPFPKFPVLGGHLTSNEQRLLGFFGGGGSVLHLFFTYVFFFFFWHI